MALLWALRLYCRAVVARPRARHAQRIEPLGRTGWAESCGNERGGEGPRSSAVEAPDSDTEELVQPIMRWGVASGELRKDARQNH